MEIKLSFNRNKKKHLEAPKTFAYPELLGGQYFYPINFASKQNKTVLVSMYNDIPEIQAPVNYIVDSMCVIPYNHYRNGEIVENSPVIAKLQTPNQYQKEDEFKRMWFINRIILGEAFVNIFKPVGMGDPNLYVLQSENTTINLINPENSDIRINGIKNYTTGWGQGSSVTIDAENVRYQLEVGLNANNYYEGRSRLMTAIMPNESLRLGYQARIKLLKDRGALGIISPANNEATITPDEAKIMRERFYQNNGLTGDKYPYQIGSRALNFTSTSMNAQELELNPSRVADMTAVCHVLDLDPILFNIGSSTYNNKILAKTSFWEDTAKAYFDSYLQFQGQEVFNLPENEELKADYSDIPSLQADLEKLTRSSSTQYNDNVITQAEYRNAIGKDGGEELFKSELDEPQTPPGDE